VKAVVGVDAEGHYRKALRLLRHIGFKETAVELVHVQKSLVVPESTASPSTVPLAVPGYMAVEVDTDPTVEILQEAQEEASGLGFESQTLGEVGNVAKELMDRADEARADLIVVGSNQKSLYGALFLGSVGRGLAIGARQSLLIAKQEVSNPGPLTAVFATDGSDYAEDCLRMLLRMHPSGIGRLVVVTAIDDREADIARAHLNKVVTHLCEEGFRAEAHAVEGSPNEVIDAMMASTQADLLVIGAQGHGFLDRLLLGSVSLQEVVGTRHSILLLRKAS